jgi:hypothetical protein
LPITCGASRARLCAGCVSSACRRWSTRVQASRGRDHHRCAAAAPGADPRAGVASGRASAKAIGRAGADRCGRRPARWWAARSPRASSTGR